MVFRYRKFDAKAYWANKPLCTLCKEHKVKNGSICYECRERGRKEKILISKNKQIADCHMDNNQDTKEVENETKKEVFGVDLFYQRLLVVEKTMHTVLAKKMAKVRTDFLKAFLKQLKKELVEADVF
jgi:hypothetical protein